MSTQKEVVLSGVGGQGLIVCGTLLGEAAVLFDGKHATLSSEYGVETRGTFTKSDVIVSERDIYYPEAIAPALVLCLAQVAYERYAGKLPEGALLIYDSDQVEALPGVPGQRGFPFTSIARELGNLSTLNIVALGLVAAQTGIVSPSAAKQAIAHFWAKRGETVVALNHRAFDTGYSLL